MTAVDKKIPLVSIIVPCRNEARTIAATLESIRAQDPIDGDCEVIVADGMSDDGTREILSRVIAGDRLIRMVDNPEGIVSTGLNRAIRAARGKIIVRMDAHSHYAPDYVFQCVRVLNETGADNVGGPWIAKGTGKWGKAIAAAFQSPFASGGGRARNPDYSGPVDTVYLGCWRREIFDRIGFFDEELARNQDDEFNLRVVRSGGRIWQSVNIKSWYHPRGSLRRLFTQYMQYGYWKACVMRKHRLPASIRHVVPAAFVLTLLVLLVLSVFSGVAFRAMLVILASYGAFILFASAALASSAGWSLFFLFPAVFATFHCAYGLGSIAGIIDFIVLKRKPAASWTALTRESSERSVR